MSTHVEIAVTDSSSIGEARRTALRLSELSGLNSTDAGRAAIVATELATNIVNHTTHGGGCLLMVADERGGAGAVEVTAVDAGPGMADVARCSVDGYSTGGTPGNGVGSVRRLADACDLYSGESGTVFWGRIVAGGTSARMDLQRRPSSLRAAGLSVAAPGESVCGDIWRLVQADDERISVMVADGLGHGPLAAEAAVAASSIFEANPWAGPRAMIESMHVALGKTRGAAVAVAQIDPNRGHLIYSAIGNIAGQILSPDGASRSLFTHNGIVGHQMQKVAIFEYPWSPDAILILHSDGLQTRWSLAEYPGLARRHPAVICGVMLRDFKRGRDDATVAVVGPPQT